MDVTRLATVQVTYRSLHNLDYGAGASSTGLWRGRCPDTVSVGGAVRGQLLECRHTLH